MAQWGMAHWLLKSEPSVFGITDLEAAPERTTFWDGVRNYQARNWLRDAMRVGDEAFFYHSNAEPAGIVGIVEVVGPGRPDPTAFDPDHPHHDPASRPEAPRWYGVDVRLVRRLRRTIPLAELKSDASLAGLALVRPGNRLSVMPIGETEWARILALE